MIFDPDRLESLYFNPLISDNVNNNVIRTRDLDPDQQLLASQESKYFLPDQFNNFIATSKKNRYSHLCPYFI